MQSQDTDAENAHSDSDERRGGTRKKMLEADGIGVGISARARFDPYGAARFLAAMERNVPGLTESPMR
jgi:predicted Zn-dependent protease